MIEVYESYVNSLPTWYSILAPLIGAACGYSFAWSITDRRMFKSMAVRQFYQRRMFRSLIGLFFCLVMLWPVPLLAWIFLSAIPHWNRSEFEILLDYEESRRNRS